MVFVLVLGGYVYLFYFDDFYSLIWVLWLVCVALVCCLLLFGLLLILACFEVLDLINRFVLECFGFGFYV